MVVGNKTGVEVVQEQTRRDIAIAVLGSFLLFILIIILAWLAGFPREDAMAMLTTVSSIVAGIVGAIVGFYFKSLDDESR